MGKRGRKKKAGKFKLLVEYALAKSILSLIKLLPFGLALRFGGLLGSLAYRLDKRHREITLDNLRNSFKVKTETEIEVIARSVYKNVGYSIIEFIFSKRYGRNFEKHFKLKNYDAYKIALNKGKGVFLLTGHCGSWELIALAQSIMKPPIGVVVRPLDNPYLDVEVSNLRCQYGNFLINKTNGMRDILKTLASGNAVGILLDQNVKAKEGVFVDFFGRPACTNKGLALMAARTKAPVIPAFLRRIGPDQHEILIGNEMPLVDTGDKEADIIANTQAYTKAIESFITDYPDQWFWMHRRWKTKPGDA